tara:strand:+ start:31 stop:1041 length:1011 start_codon:yes stop_codon:yes gene_type:complete
MSVFTRFDFDNDVVENQRTKVSSGIFSGGSGTLNTYFSSSTAGSVSASFVSVFNKATSDATSEVQFDFGYANIDGSGSAGNTTKLNTGGRQSAAMYRQFRNVLLAPDTQRFTFTGASSGSNDFYFITFNRARMREKIDPGNWELVLGSANLKLIDDSGATNNPTVNEGGRVFNIVSGSLETGVGVINTAAASQPGGCFGNFYPDLGIILLDASQLDASASLGTGRSSDTFDNNNAKFFQSLSDGGKFQVRREEEISSTNFFCRVNNKKYNFSANPTYFTGSDGSFVQSTFFKDPKVYITTVGLYNDDNELLAVAKLSKPILKSYSREAIIKVKLDF